LAQAPNALGLSLAMLVMFLLGRRWFARYAVIATLALALAVTYASGQWRLTLPQIWATPIWVAPSFTWSATLSLALPLFFVTMASQNLPGVAAAKHAGYELPVSKLISFSGVMTLVLAPFGAFALNLAAVTAAICLGPEAHPNPAKRYTASACCGLFYLFAGCAGAAIAGVIAAFPTVLVLMLAALALLPTIASALGQALSNEVEREAAGLAFLVTLSGVNVAGIGSPFWGVVVGVLALCLSRRQDQA
jgi:benzoate membrane transport protein